MNTATAKRRKLPSSTWDEIRTAHASGLGLRELARSMKIPPGTIMARAKREGWTRRVQSARTLAQQAPAPDVGGAVALSMAERGRRHLERMAGVVEKTLPHVEGLAPEAVLDRIEEVDRLDKIGRRTFNLDERGGGAVRINILAGDPFRVAVEDVTASA